MRAGGVQLQVRTGGVRLRVRAGGVRLRVRAGGVRLRVTVSEHFAPNALGQYSLTPRSSFGSCIEWKNGEGKPGPVYHMNCIRCGRGLPSEKHINLYVFFERLPARLTL